MNKRIDDRFADGLSLIIRNFLTAGATFFKLPNNGGVSLDEGKGLLNQPGFDNLASVV